MPDDDKVWIRKSDKPRTVGEGDGWQSNKKQAEPDARGLSGSAKVLGGDYKIVTVNTPTRKQLEAEGSAGLASLAGQKQWTYGAVGGEVDVLYGKTNAHLGMTEHGAGAQGEISGVGWRTKANARLGTETTNVGVAGEVKAFVAEAKGQLLAGDDGRYIGLAASGQASLTAMSGEATGSGSLSLDWVPFMPKGWTIGAEGKIGGQVGTAEAGGGAWAFYDRADGRFHLGTFEQLGLVFGQKLFGEITIGPAKPPKPGEAEKEGAVDSFIRPIARVMDPLGAHSSSYGWLGLALGAALAIAAIVAFPVIIGVGVVGTGLMASAMIGLGAVSLVTGAAAIGAKFGKLIKTEDGSPCSQIVMGSSKTKCEGQWVARINDPNSHGAGKLKTGAKFTYEGGWNVSRVKEASTCGAAKVLKGANKTFVGGPSVSSGAPDEPTAGDALLDRVIETLDTISTVTGLAQLPLLGVSAAMKGGTMALGRIAAGAAERTTFREALTIAASKGVATSVARREAVQALVNGMPTAARVAGGATVQVAKEAWQPAAWAVADKWGSPHASAALQSAGFSKEFSEAATQGFMLAGPAAIGGYQGRNSKGTIAGEVTNARESWNASSWGERIFGKPVTSATPTTGATDDVAGAARGASPEPAGAAPRTAEPATAPRPAEPAPAPRPAEPAGAPPRGEPIARAPELVPPPRVGDPVTAPRTGEATAPRTGEATAPRTGEATAPRTGEATAPRTGEATAPRTGEATAPRTGEATAPRTGEATAPRTGEPVVDGTRPATVEPVVEAAPVVQEKPAVTPRDPAAPIEVLRPSGDGDHMTVRTLDPDTKVYRVQHKNQAIEPHKSPYFEPTEYGVKPQAPYEALYVSTNRETLQALREGQGYLKDPNMVMHETTIGEVLRDAGDHATVFEDVKFNATVDNANDSGFVIVRRSDGVELPRIGREPTAAERAFMDAPKIQAAERAAAAKQQQAVSTGVESAKSGKSEGREIYRDLKAAGNTELASQVFELATPFGFGGKEARLAGQPELRAAADAFRSSNAAEQLRAGAKAVAPEIATKMNALAAKVEGMVAQWGSPVSPTGGAACTTCGGASTASGGGASPGVVP